MNSTSAVKNILTVMSRFGSLQKVDCPRSIKLLILLYLYNYKNLSIISIVITLIFI
jgi:hypothetical protein